MDAESRCIYTLLDARTYVGGLFVAWTELIQGVVEYCDWKVGDGDNEAGAEGGGGALSHADLPSAGCWREAGGGRAS